MPRNSAEDSAQLTIMNTNLKNLGLLTSKAEKLFSNIRESSNSIESDKYSLHSNVRPIYSFKNS